MPDEIIVENMSLKEGIYHASNFPDSFQPDMPEEGLDVLDVINHTSFWHKHRAFCIANALKKFMPQDSGWLADVGGGNGYLAKFLAESGLQTVLFEPAYSGVKNAQQRGVKNIIWGLLDASIVREGCVPAIGLFDVLEHIESDGDFIQNFRPFLRNDGIIICTVPAHNFLWSEKDDFVFHKRRYSLKQVRKLFVENGYDIVYGTYFFSLLLPAVFLLKSLPYRLFGKAKTAFEAQEKITREHKQNRLLFSIFAYERMLIKYKKRLPIGASILLVAKKVMQNGLKNNE